MSSAPVPEHALSRYVGTGIATLFGVLGYSLLRFSGAPPAQLMAAALAIVIAVAIGYPIGLVFGHVISRDGDVDATGFRVIGWLNLVGWPVPVIGVTLSAMTWLFSRRSDANRGLYWWLSLIGGILALGSAAAGGWFASSERTSARCPLAARERWSASEIQTYCSPLAAGDRSRVDMPAKPAI